VQLTLRDHIVDPSDWPVVMGVLNVTPDSFSDGGRFESSGAAVAAAMGMIADGAAIVDVGPESTRPGSSSVSDDEQISRAIPAIERIRAKDAAITISIDTTSARVARAAIDAGELEQVVRVAVRMLDNAIDVSRFPLEAQTI